MQLIPYSKKMFYNENITGLLLFLKQAKIRKKTSSRKDINDFIKIIESNKIILIHESLYSHYNNRYFVFSVEGKEIII